MFEDRINEIMEAVHDAAYELRKLQNEVKAEHRKAHDINGKEYAKVQMLERQYDFYDGAKEISNALDEAYDRYNETDHAESELCELMEWLNKTINTLDFI